MPMRVYTRVYLLYAYIHTARATDLIIRLLWYPTTSMTGWQPVVRVFCLCLKEKRCKGTTISRNAQMREQ